MSGSASESGAFLGQGSEEGLTRLLLRIDLESRGLARLAAMRDDLFDSSWVRQGDPTDGAGADFAWAYLVGLDLEAGYGDGRPFDWIADLHVLRLGDGVRAEGHLVARLGFRGPRPQLGSVRGGALAEWLVTVTGDDPEAWRRLDSLSRTWRGTLGELVATERAIAR